MNLLSLAAFTTARLHLRPLTARDGADFRTLTDEPGIIAAIDFLRAPFTLRDAQALIVGNGDGRDCFWGVSLLNAAPLIGTVGTHLRGAAAIEVGYWFAASARGQGYAREAVTALVGRLASAWPDREIYAEARAENRASWRLLENLGFRADGRSGQREGRRRLVLNLTVARSP